MILTVTINPLLERRYVFNKIKTGIENRNGENFLNAGGKGINVSRQLNHLGINNLAFTFLGGDNGKTLANVLRDEQIKFSTVKTKSSTRDAAIIIEEDNKSISTFFSKNSEIRKQEVEEFLTKLDKMIQNSEIVVFAGSSPCKQSDIIFPEGIKLANKYGRISLVDTYGDHLKNCIDSSPTILHNNISELESSLNIFLKDEKDKIQFLNHLYSKDIKQAFLTDGKNSTFASNFDYHYQVENPNINVVDATGSGDSFTAGIVFGWRNSLIFEEQLKFASALGAANAKTYETCRVKKEDAEEVIKKIKISTIGKKMKTIDDSAH